MPALARADLESLLRARKLDVTLTSSLPLAGAEHAVASSGLPVLDAQLAGGWPRGQLSEITGPRSSGRTWVAVQSLSAATRRGELAALVDTFDAFDPESAASAGPDWSHFLWVRGLPLAHTRARSGARSAGPGQDLLDQAVDRAVKAAAIVLAAGGFGLVVLDLADVPAQILRRLPFTTWLRLQRLLEGRDTACLLVAGEPLGRSAGGVALALAPDSVTGRWRGDSHHARRLEGIDARGRVVRARLAGSAGCEFVPWP